jgi:hypothetical protein
MRLSAVADWQFPYTEAVVRESLRLYPPATLLNREIREGGFDVAPGVRGSADEAAGGTRTSCTLSSCSTAAMVDIFQLPLS